MDEAASDVLNLYETNFGLEGELARNHTKLTLERMTAVLIIVLVSRLMYMCESD